MILWFVQYNIYWIIPITLSTICYYILFSYFHKIFIISSTSITLLYYLLLNFSARPSRDLVLPGATASPAVLSRGSCFCSLSPCALWEPCPLCSSWPHWDYSFSLPSPQNSPDLDLKASDQSPRTECPECPITYWFQAILPSLFLTVIGHLSLPVS